MASLEVISIHSGSARSTCESKKATKQGLASKQQPFVGLTLRLDETRVGALVVDRNLLG